MSARILIADDHAVVRQGLREMFAQCPDLRVVAEAADGLEAERLARTLELDLLLLDVAMPGCRGIEVLESLRRSGLALPVVFFSMYPAAQYADYVRRAGGQGFLSKDADGATVIACLRRVLAGEPCFPRRNRRAAVPANPFDTLSRREQDVLRGLLQGHTARAVAAQLGITDKSVGTYRRRILDKLKVSSNAEAISLALRFGFS